MKRGPVWPRLTGDMKSTDEQGHQCRGFSEGFTLPPCADEGVLLPARPAHPHKQKRQCAENQPHSIRNPVAAGRMMKLASGGRR